MNIPQDIVKSLKLVHHAADDLGCSIAMVKLGCMYNDGLHGAPIDKVRGRKYLVDAIKMGNTLARYTLGMIEEEEGNSDLAIRHWKLAAAAGEDFSVKKLWTCFFKGNLEKADLEETLRAHKDACDTMNSVERERCKLFEKTRKERKDSLLLLLFGNYYNGEMNAKQLTEALKVYQSLNE